jgi:hypothetical protein
MKKGTAIDSVMPVNPKMTAQTMLVKLQLKQLARTPEQEFLLMRLLMLLAGVDLTLIVNRHLMEGGVNATRKTKPKQWVERNVQVMTAEHAHS